MNSNDLLNKANKAKDILEIRSAIEKTKSLLESGNIQELQKHLQELRNKYLVETIVYNTTHTVKPRSIQENALNCIDFLNVLLTEKGAETLEDNRKKE